MESKFRNFLAVGGVTIALLSGQVSYAAESDQDNTGYYLGAGALAAGVGLGILALSHHSNDNNNNPSSSPSPTPPIPHFWHALGGPRGGNANSFATLTTTSNGTKLFAASDTGVFVSTDNGETWATSLGGYNIKNLVAFGSQLLYANTGTSILVSKDAGQTWSSEDTTTPFYGQTISALTVDHNGVVYIGVNRKRFVGASHLYASYDQGKTWSQESADLPGSTSAFDQFAIAPDNTVYVLFSTGQGQVSSPENAEGNVFKKAPASGWTSTGDLPFRRNTFLSNMVIDQNGFVYIGTQDIYISGMGVVDRYGPNERNDWGWSTIFFDTSAYPRSLLVDNNKIISGGDDGRLRYCNLSASQDSCLNFGTDWQTSANTTGYRIDDLFFSHGAANTNTLFAATQVLNGEEGGVYTTQDFAATAWAPPGPMMLGKKVVAFAENSANVVAGLNNNNTSSGNDAVMLSGQTSKNVVWHLPQVDLPALNVIHRPLIQNNYIYYPAAYSWLYTSQDGGANWSHQRFVVPNFNNTIGAYSYFIEAMGLDALGTIYLNLWDKVVASVNHGVTWTDFFTNSQVRALTMGSGKVFVAVEPNSDKNDGKAIYESNRDGATVSWISLGFPDTNFSTDQLAVDNSVLYAGGQLSQDSSNIQFVVYATNIPTAKNTTSWTPICQNEPSVNSQFINFLVPDTNRHYLYTIAESSNQMIYFYDGSSCTAKSTLPENTIVDLFGVDPNTGKLFATFAPIFANANLKDAVKEQNDANQLGLSVSTDHGATWTAIPVFSDQIIQDIAFDATTGKIYVATIGKGVFVSTDGGVNWVTENTGLNPIAVRFFSFDEQNNIYAAPIGGVLYKGGWSICLASHFILRDKNNPNPISFAQRRSNSVPLKPKK